MLNVIKTLEEAKAYRYCVWGGEPKGRKYVEGRCAYEVWPSGRGPLPYQCHHKNGKGLNGLYCGIHAKKVS